MTRHVAAICPRHATVGGPLGRIRAAQARMVGRSAGSGSGPQSVPTGQKFLTRAFHRTVKQIMNHAMKEPSD